MTSVSISQLKANPSRALLASMDQPLPVKNRDKVQAYLVGKDLFEKMVSVMENIVDINAAKEADYKDTTTLEDLAEELGLT